MVCRTRITIYLFISRLNSAGPVKTLLVLWIVSLSSLLAQRPELSKHYLGVGEALTPPSARLGRDIALDYVRGLAADLQLTAPDLAGVYVAKEYDTAHNGVHHVIFRQQ